MKKKEKLLSPITIHLTKKEWDYLKKHSAIISVGKKVKLDTRTLSTTKPSKILFNICRKIVN